MRASFLFISLILMFFIISGSNYLFAQPAQGSVVVMTNHEGAFSDDGSGAEFDSLTAELHKWTMANNEDVLYHTVLRHWWGNNNRDIIEVTVVKDWASILTANQKSVELFNAHWDTKAKRDAFNNAYDKYFTGKHSDEIYREVYIPENMEE